MSETVFYLVGAAGMLIAYCLGLWLLAVAKRRAEDEAEMLKGEVEVRDDIIFLLLEGYDPNLKAGGWVKKIWSHPDNPPEMEGMPFTPDDRRVLARIHSRHKKQQIYERGT